MKEVEIVSASYRELIREIVNRYPGFSEADLNSYMVSIDGVIIQTPFLEKLGPNSKLIFIKKVAAG